MHLQSLASPVRQIILPPGQYRRTKRIRFTRIRNWRTCRRVPARQRGVSRSSRHADRNAVDAGGVGAKAGRRAASRRERRPRAKRPRCSRTAKSRGPGARHWRQVLRWCERPNRVRDASAIRKATVATEFVSPGRARHKPSNHCAGKAGRFRLRLWSYPLCIIAHRFSTEAMGASRHPVFPAPSSWRG